MIWHCEDWVQEYLNSNHFLFLDENFKDDAEEMLLSWIQCMTQVQGQFPLELSRSEFRLATTERWLPGITKPLLRQNCTLLLSEFFEFISSARFPAASTWIPYAEECKSILIEKIRQDGSIKGQTQVNKGSKIERNEICFCGSGKKFKKCCGPGLKL